MLRFLGAAGTVTGSKFLLTAGDSCVLIDCGLFQGIKEQRLRNWDRLPVDAELIKSVMLSHAHLDHSGYLPVLCRSGFKGRVFSTPGTYALCRILLPDSGHLQEEEAAYANRRGYSKHTPALPLYTEEDAWKSLNHFSATSLGSPFETDRCRVTFRHAGHILGASSLLVETGEAFNRRVLFSGDLGRPSHPLLRAPDPPPRADVIVVESTYGDRLHDDQGALDTFAQAIARTADRAGVMVIPSFAVDRTEIVLFYLRRLQQEGRIPALPVYVDSPMALAALKLYQDAMSSGDPTMRPEVAGKPEVLEPDSLTEVKTVEESIALNSRRGPMIIISASGMATGGRVLHHLAHRLPDERNTVMLVGYQAEGTRGRLLLEGASAVKMLGRHIPVRAEIVNIPAFSVHADRSEIISWLKSAAAVPEVVYVVHGDPAAAEALRATIVRELRWNAVVPRYLERVRLD
ncbi:MAG TPA: MBL fold metallo-hydrolase [Candidatus Binataceae bacterium]|nr:MBL fold metallo-hydrolase [Candidatus Binataceae bacterium]